jgi:hypothetical protein
MLRAVITSLLQPLTRRVWKSLTIGEHSGIAIVDLSRAKAGRQYFLGRTTDALQLLQRADPRRFRRVREHLKYIVHRELPFGYGQYEPGLAACYVDFTRLDFTKSYNMMLWTYAAILVHEATHAALQSRGIPYSSNTRERVERLCNTESARFLRRHTRRAGDLWEQIMNRPGRRRRSWTATRWQSLTALWKRRGVTAQLKHQATASDEASPHR